MPLSFHIGTPYSIRETTISASSITLNNYRYIYIKNQCNSKPADKYKICLFVKECSVVYG